MTSLIGLIPGDVLVLGGNRYKLLGVAGGGGSSIVYLAEPVDSISAGQVMIKELCPCGCFAEREKEGAKAGSLVVPPPYRDRFDAVMGRARQESKIAEKLRNDRAGIRASEQGISPGRSNSPWLLEYSEPIEANGTLYTVIQTKSGETLAHLIGRGFFEDKDFAFICDCFTKVLDALEHIHSRGYLHLDIAPDNIFVPEYSPGFGEIVHVHLIDFNSALEKGTEPAGWAPSHKEGYSAPELDRTATKPAGLDETADLYSAAAIFFELLVGRKLKRTDRGSFNSWKLTRESGVFAGATDLLAGAANEFLLQGVAKAASCRFRTVAEMRAAVGELRSLSKRKVLRNRQKLDPAQGCFVGMAGYLAKIDSVLEKNSYVFVEGIGGIGKTELAKEYAEEHRHKYDIVQFISYDGSLQSTVGRQLRFHNYDEDVCAARYKDAFNSAALDDKAANERVEEKLFDDKLSFLEGHSGRALIIVDNYDVAFDAGFGRFVAGNHKVIFTSRAEHKTNTVVVKGVGEDELPALFGRYYSPRRIAEKDAPAIIEMARLASWHTMTIKLVAAALSASESTVESMLERLRSGVVGVGAYAEIDKEGFSSEERERTVSEHIRKLFNMSDIRNNGDYAFIMANLAIVPHGGMFRKDFYSWALSERYRGNQDKADRDINNLRKLRWLQVQEEEATGKQTVSLHPLISEVANSELLPDSDKCGPLIEGLLSLENDCESKTYIEQNACAGMMGFACSRILDETETTAALYACNAMLNRVLARYEKALELYMKALAVCERALGTGHPRTGDIYNNMAMVYSGLGDYERALELFAKDLAICEKVFGPEHSSTATNYNNQALAFHYRGDYMQALRYFTKSLDIREKLLGMAHPDTVASYLNIACTYYMLGEHGLARIYRGKAMQWSPPPHDTPDREE